MRSRFDCSERADEGTDACHRCTAPADMRLCDGAGNALLTVSCDSQWVRMLAIRLESCGIPCRVVSSDDGPDIREIVPEDADCRFRVLVPDLMLIDARLVLNREVLPS